MILPNSLVAYANGKIRDERVRIERAELTEQGKVAVWAQVSKWKVSAILCIQTQLSHEGERLILSELEILSSQEGSLVQRATSSVIAKLVTWFRGFVIAQAEDLLSPHGIELRV